MKNFKLLFLFLVILFVSTEAAPKGGRGGGGSRGGGRRGGGYYGGGGGGDGDFGELPTWLIILIFVFATIFLTTCLYKCINYCADNDEENSNLQSVHENRVPNENDQRNQYWLHPTAPSLEPQVDSAQISNSAHLPYALNPIQTSQSSNLYSDQPYVVHNSHTTRY